jgi:hypothetical protein
VAGVGGGGDEAVAQRGDPVARPRPGLRRLSGKA